MKSIFLLTPFFLIVNINPLLAQRTEKFDWLVGDWEIVTPKGKVVESWQQINDSTLIGQSLFITSEGETIPQETIDLSLRNGSWLYAPRVQNQNENKPVPFKVILLQGSEFICENPAHDFPQRISYRRIGNKLYASIEGVNKGKFAKRNFDFVSVDK